MRLGLAALALPEPYGTAAHCPPRLVAATEHGTLDVAAAAEVLLRESGATAVRAAELAAGWFPPSLSRVLGGGERALAQLAEIVETAPPEAILAGPVRLRCPVDPPAFRDFMIFDEHVRGTYALADRLPPDILYDRPVYYKGSTGTLLGPDDEVPWPHYAGSLDYELEFGVVVGRAGRDLEPEQALDHLFGITVVNDLSARDVQFSELRGRLGPAKGKDFATAVGPWVVTLDELDPHDLRMSVRVNGEPVGTGSSAGALWSIEEVVAWASAAEPLRPGELIGSGTVGGGSGLERGRFLAAGDVVDAAIEGVGNLRNRIGARAATGWTPIPRHRAG